MAERYLKWRGHPKFANPETTYDEGALFTANNHEFVDDPAFRRAIDVSRQSPFASRGYHSSRWKVHTVLWAAQHALNLQGEGADIVQLGVFEGSEAAAIADYVALEKQPIQMILVDTFTGVPAEQWTADELEAKADQAQWIYKEAGDIYQSVRNRFSKYKNVAVVQGRVPEVLSSLNTSRIGLLLIDLNCAAPEQAAMEYLWDRIVPGGMIISDDYGNIGYHAQKVVMDDFAKQKGVSVLSHPTGHGIILKP